MPKRSAGMSPIDPLSSELVSDTLMEPSSPNLGLDKLLALAIYGETVAAYRYLVLSEKPATEAARRFLAGLADEEQAHKQRLQKTLAERFPQADFVLTPEDKELVVTGPRLLDVHREVALTEAMAMLLETEQKVADFYARHCEAVPDPDLRALFRQLADDSAEHLQRLRNLALSNPGPEPSAPESRTADGSAIQM